MNLDNETSQPTAVDAGRSVKISPAAFNKERHEKLQRHEKGRKTDGHVKQRRPEHPDRVHESVLDFAPSSIVHVHVEAHSTLPFANDIELDQENLSLFIQGCNLFSRPRLISPRLLIV